MIPIRFGIELEMVGPDADFVHTWFRRNFKRNIGYGSSMRGWSYDEDCSVGKNGMEIRTPAFRSLKELSSLRRPLSTLRSFCWTTCHAGMHIHISAPSKYAIDVKPFADAIWARYGRFIQWGRRGFCLRGVATPDDVENGSRYRAVCHVHRNHVEVRVFNATLDYLTVYRRVVDVVALYRHFLYPSKQGLTVARISRRHKKLRRYSRRVA